jgi:hypothetical protein
MYRRDSPSHNRSVFTFVEETSKNETESAGDTGEVFVVCICLVNL